ncbi:MAG TPA: TonB-dependent siderophore receptor [Geminicoccaceae bacterium]|nr:TonB-dependent siderophore receptor [Geminicoccus sp.]HMU51713.1 TonB-dependent siderophore receptor [Geminicoccaceae bacterium]
MTPTIVVTAGRPPGGAPAGRRRTRAWLLATAAIATASPVVAATGIDTAGERQDRPRGPQPDARHRQAGRQQVAQAATRAFDIPPQPLAQALMRFGRESGLQLFFDDAMTRGVASAGARGSFTPQQALDRLLAGTGLTYRFADGNTVTLTRIAEAGDGAMVLDPIAVESAAARFGDLPEAPGFKADFQASATKMPLPIRETPQAVSVTTRESIDRRQARDLNTALELTAGVVPGISSGGGPFAGPSARVADQFSLRGQRLDGDRDVRIDGFAGAGMRNDFDLAAFERVEVVKGPSSMLYGQGSLGGFINLVRKRPLPEPTTLLTGQAGSYDTYRAEADVTGPFDEAARLLGRMTVAYEDAGSFIDGVESRRVLAAPTLEVKLGENTRAILDLLYQRDNFRPSPGIPLRLDGDRLKEPNVSRSFYFGVPAEKDSTASARSASLRLDHEIDDRWLATLLLQGIHNERRGISDNYGYGFYGDGDTYVYASIVDHENDAWAGELRLDGRFDAFGREHNLLLGIESNEREQDSRSGSAYLGTANIYLDNFEDVGTVAGQSLPFDFDSTSTSRNQGAYAQLVLSVLERTRLLVGARYDDADQRNRDNLAETNDHSSDQAFTFRVGLSQDLTDQITAYATWAQSFSPVSDQSASGKILDPETGEGYEVGLKSEWLDGALAANVAVFQQELDNRPIPDPNNGAGEFFSVSGGLQRTRGIELELSGEPIAGLTLGAAAAWLDSEYIDNDDPNHGLTPPETTDRTLSLFASYELQEGPLRGLGFGATLVSVGDRWSIKNNENVSPEGYERVDLHGYYDGVPGLDLSLQVRNVLDATYIERSNGAYGYGNYFGAPRSVMARVAVRF